MRKCSHGSLVHLFLCRNVLYAGNSHNEKGRCLCMCDTGCTTSFFPTQYSHSSIENRVWSSLYAISLLLTSLKRSHLPSGLFSTDVVMLLVLLHLKMPLDFFFLYKVLSSGFRGGYISITRLDLPSVSFPVGASCQWTFLSWRHGNVFNKENIFQNDESRVRNK